MRTRGSKRPQRSTLELGDEDLKGRQMHILTKTGYEIGQIANVTPYEEYPYEVLIQTTGEVQYLQLTADNHLVAADQQAKRQFRWVDTAARQAGSPTKRQKHARNNQQTAAVPASPAVLQPAPPAAQPALEQATPAKAASPQDPAAHQTRPSAAAEGDLPPANCSPASPQDTTAVASSVHSPVPSTALQQKAREQTPTTPHKQKRPSSAGKARALLQPRSSPAAAAEQAAVVPIRGSPGAQEAEHPVAAAAVVGSTTLAQSTAAPPQTDATSQQQQLAAAVGSIIAPTASASTPATKKLGDNMTSASARPAARNQTRASTRTRSAAAKVSTSDAAAAATTKARVPQSRRAGRRRLSKAIDDDEEEGGATDGAVDNAAAIAASVQQSPAALAAQQVHAAVPQQVASDDVMGNGQTPAQSNGAVPGQTVATAVASSMGVLEEQHDRTMDCVKKSPSNSEQHAVTGTLNEAKQVKEETTVEATTVAVLEGWQGHKRALSPATQSAGGAAPPPSGSRRDPRVAVQALVPDASKVPRLAAVALPTAVRGTSPTAPGPASQPSGKAAGLDRPIRLPKQDRPCFGDKHGTSAGLVALGALKGLVKGPAKGPSGPNDAKVGIAAKTKEELQELLLKNPQLLQATLRQMRRTASGAAPEFGPGISVPPSGAATPNAAPSEQAHNHLSSTPATAATAALATPVATGTAQARTPAQPSSGEADVVQNGVAAQQPVRSVPVAGSATAVAEAAKQLPAASKPARVSVLVSHFSKRDSAIAATAEAAAVQEPEYVPEATAPAPAAATAPQVSPEFLQTMTSTMSMMLNTLQRTKESITAATHFAIVAAEGGASKAVYRLILERLSGEPVLTRRVNFFYLVDSILNRSHRQRKEVTAGGRMPSDRSHKCEYAPLVAAGLPRLVTALLEVPEGPAKLQKVLRLWDQGRLMPHSVLEAALKQVEAAQPAARPAERLTEEGINPFGSARKDLLLLIAAGQRLRIGEEEGAYADDVSSATDEDLPGSTAALPTSPLVAIPRIDKAALSTARPPHSNFSWDDPTSHPPAPLASPSPDYDPAWDPLSTRSPLKSPLSTSPQYAPTSWDRCDEPPPLRHTGGARSYRSAASAPWSGRTDGTDGTADVLKPSYGSDWDDDDYMQATPDHAPAMAAAKEALGGPQLSTAVVTGAAPAAAGMHEAHVPASALHAAQLKVCDSAARVAPGLAAAAVGAVQRPGLFIGSAAAQQPLSVAAGSHVGRSSIASDCSGFPAARDVAPAGPGQSRGPPHPSLQTPSNPRTLATHTLLHPIPGISDSAVPRMAHSPAVDDDEFAELYSVEEDYSGPARSKPHASHAPRPDVDDMLKLYTATDGAAGTRLVGRAVPAGPPVPVDPGGSPPLPAESPPPLPAEESPPPLPDEPPLPPDDDAPPPLPAESPPLPSPLPPALSAASHYFANHPAVATTSYLNAATAPAYYPGRAPKLGLGQGASTAGPTAGPPGAPLRPTFAAGAASLHGALAAASGNMGADNMDIDTPDDALYAAAGPEPSLAGPLPGSLQYGPSSNGRGLRHHPAYHPAAF